LTVGWCGRFLFFVVPRHFSLDIGEWSENQILILIGPISIVLTPSSLHVFFPFQGWRQDNGNRSNQESKFDFLATLQRLVKIDEGQQKIKIVRTNRQSNLLASCQSIFSLSWHHRTKGNPKENQKGGGCSEI